MQSVNKNSIAIQFSCLAMVIITLIPFGRGDISGLEIAFPFSMLSLFFFLLRKNKRNKHALYIILFISLWSVWVLSGITYSYMYYPGSTDHIPAYLRYFRMLEMYIPGVLILAFSRGINERQQKRVAFFFIILFILVTLETSVGFFLQSQALTATQMYKYPGMGYVFRAGGVAKDSSAYSNLILLLGFTAFIELRRAGRNSFLFTVILICFLINIYLSMSRSLLVAALVYFVFKLGLERKIKPLTLMLIAVSIISLLIFGMNNEYLSSFWGRLSGANQQDISSGRFTTWALLLGLVGDNPLLGVGYRLSTEKYGLIPDNMFLSLSVETGVIGLLLYLSFLLSLCSFVYKNNRDKFPLIMAYTISGMFIDISTFWVSVPLFLFTMSIYKKRDIHDEGE
ncbi:O-antigen ligase family protein [Rahnella bonaserana]|jgi:O-antigen ligase|uniref:O-antigen ligase family protein n=2 Tax=Rahnella bonaserana TaxID=2816248 RepID=A0ABS6LQ69_9GAMM|nr:O-antigen ligase family protein [Rahnella bonaserana]MBU9854261.1 O-antigen ligase family protein [Rahnella bonaserana]MCL9643175.1 O-antigen ligase family protein [Rahnella victoriana]